MDDVPVLTLMMGIGGATETGAAGRIVIVGCAWRGIIDTGPAPLVNILVPGFSCGAAADNQYSKQCQFSFVKYG